MLNKAEQEAKRGILIVLSSPSGAGKTTIASELIQKDENCVLSVSHTTRAPRKEEIDGKDYFFVGEDKFKQMVCKWVLIKREGIIS